MLVLQWMEPAPVRVQSLVFAGGFTELRAACGRPRGAAVCQQPGLCPWGRRGKVLLQGHRAVSRAGSEGLSEGLHPSLCSGSCASLILLHVRQGPAACHQPGNPLSPRQGTSVSLSQMVFLMHFKPVAFCAVTLTIKNRLFFSTPKSFQVCELLVLRPSHPSALQSTPVQVL